MWRPKLGIPLAAIVLGVLWMSNGTLGQSSPAPSTRNGEWPHYTADLRGTKYSPLDQINASNFKDLEVAWRFKTDSLGTRPEYKLEGTPLMIGGVLYTTGGTRRSTRAPASCCGCTAIRKARAARTHRGSCRVGALPIGLTGAATTASSTSHPVTA
jgi:hypothetical protein